MKIFQCLFEMKKKKWGQHTHNIHKNNKNKERNEQKKLLL